MTKARTLALPEFIAAFFSTPVFRLERGLLLLAGHRSDDAQIAALALGAGTEMAAWRVEDRTAREILLTVPGTPIRTWLAVDDDALWFGSVIVADAAGRIPTVARLLMPFHAAYSRVLLSAARRRVMPRS